MKKMLVHHYPIWYEQANFLIAAKINQNYQPAIEQWEQLWVQQLPNDRYKICCIPFFTYGLALGDEVEIDETHVVQRVVTNSGYRIFRVWLYDIEIRENLLTTVSKLGCLSEAQVPDGKLIAVATNSQWQTEQLLNFLRAKNLVGELIFEEG